MIVTKTPLRISFFSGGSDMKAFYEKEDGAALSVTIDKYIYVLLHRTPHLGVKIMYDKIEETPDVETMQHEITKEALKYFNFTKEITVASISDILSKGSGLGSSSAFTVGLVNALASSKWEVASKRYLADVACEIEIDKCGYPIGKQDQYAAEYGGMNLFHFRKNGDTDVENIHVGRSNLDAFQSNLLLVYSGHGRSANSILQKQQKAMGDKEKFNLVRQSRDKAFLATQYLQKGLYDDFGALLHEAWMDKKQVVGSITDEYFDMVYSKAMTSGALGGKLLGAGGGGFFLFYVDKQHREKVIDTITTDTACKVYDFTFSHHGSSVSTLF